MVIIDRWVALAVALDRQCLGDALATTRPYSAGCQTAPVVAASVTTPHNSREAGDNSAVACAGHWRPKAAASGTRA
ncbi:MAG: hypothetical protein U0941_27410 [Planctomycetaceae bacterium]